MPHDPRMLQGDNPAHRPINWSKILITFVVIAVAGMAVLLFALGINHDRKKQQRHDEAPALLKDHLKLIET